MACHDLLILTQYFPPETGAPQNRLFELAKYFQRQGVRVSVLTAMPHYPRMQLDPAYQGQTFVHEMQGGIPVYRSWIYVTERKSIPFRLLNYFSFVGSSMLAGLTQVPRHTWILCESPPLFLGLAAMLLKRHWKAKLIFNVSDLWPESAEKLGLVTQPAFLKAAMLLEEQLYREADVITGQTQGIVANIAARFPRKRVYWLPNGADLHHYPADTVADQAWRQQVGIPSDALLILYAGVIGHAQGLEVIVGAAERLRHVPIHWVLLGHGPEKARLQALAQDLPQVHFLEPVGKAAMPGIVAASDVAVVPLRRLPLFEGAIPSKIFENLALAKPLLLGVEGEAHTLFIEQAQAGLAFTPEDPDSLAEQALKLFENPALRQQWGTNGQAYVTAHFDRAQIAQKFQHYLAGLAP